MSKKKNSKSSKPQKSAGSINEKAAQEKKDRQIEKKLKEYLLNLNHPVGGAKAEFFKSIGYTKRNWKSLAKQLVFNPKKATKRPTTNFGIPYSLVITIQSADGSQSYNLVTGWFKKNGENEITLTTAYPE